MVDVIKRTYVVSQELEILHFETPIWNFILREITGVKTVEDFKYRIHRITKVMEIPYQAIRIRKDLPYGADRYYMLLNGCVVPRELSDIQGCLQKPPSSFFRESIGSSNKGSLVMRGSKAAKLVKFDKSGSYTAYECYGNNVVIDKDAKKVFSDEEYLIIYDDKGISYNIEHFKNFKKYDIYKKGECGCIIHWHN